MESLLKVLIMAMVGGLFTCHILTCDVSAQEDDQSKGRGKRRNDNAPKAGEMAPTFKLKSLNSEEVTELASFKGKKPVVLLFGSYT